MTLVATLISAPDGPVLNARTIDVARRALGCASDADWLALGVAVDIPFTGGNASDIREFAEAVRGKLGGAPIDVVVTPAQDRRKRLLLADMDSTMIEQECIDELADYVGLKGHVAAITERAMRGEIAFEPALIERVALLRGLPVTVVKDVIANRITLTPGARTLVATMRAHGAHACLVSGGFTLFTEKIAAMIGFDESSGNQLLIEADGRLAGRVAEPILGRDGKLATLMSLCERLRLSPRDAMVVGDGANDLAMITAAGLGVAFHAKPAVAAAAGVRIDHGDLTALLYAQGYRREEFVAA